MGSTSLNLGFREATPTDHADILAIHNANVRDRRGSSTNGFLLAPVTEAEIQAKCDRQTQYFVAHLVNTVVGFVTLSRPTLTEEMLSHVQWNESALLTQVLHAQPIYIQTVATHPEFSGRGVAQCMYRSLSPLPSPSGVLCSGTTIPRSAFRSSKLRSGAGISG